RSGMGKVRLITSSRRTPNLAVPAKAGTHPEMVASAPIVQFVTPVLTSGQKRPPPYPRPIQPAPCSPDNPALLAAGAPNVWAGLVRVRWGSPQRRPKRSPCRLLTEQRTRESGRDVISKASAMVERSQPDAAVYAQNPGCEGRDAVRIRRSPGIDRKSTRLN